MTAITHTARESILKGLLSTLLFVSLIGVGAAQSPVGERVDAQPLNSDGILAAFGSYGVEVVRQDENVRVSSLYSVTGNAKTTRTLAIVLFAEDIPDALQAEHEEIIDGASIGSTFRESGWQINKTTIYLGEIRAAGNAKLIDRWLSHAGNAIFAIHIYEFDVMKDGSLYKYATIAEIHDPAYISLADLIKTYSNDGGSRQRLDAQSADALRRVFMELNR